MITIWWNVTMVTMVGTHITYNIMHLYYFVFRTCYLKYETHQLLRLKKYIPLSEGDLFLHYYALLSRVSRLDVFRSFICLYSKKDVLLPSLT